MAPPSPITSLYTDNHDEPNERDACVRGVLLCPQQPTGGGRHAHSPAAVLNSDAMPSLDALIHRLAHAGLPPQPLLDSSLTPDIDHLAHDSRKVGPNGLFVALRGAQTDGHLFLDKAVQNGAIAILVEATPDEAVRTRAAASGVVLLQVSDTHAAWAELAAAFYGDPSHDLALVGVTGTNGKSTTTWLIHHLVTALGEKAGLIGTIAYRIGDRALPASHTTPDALDLQRMLRQMAEAGCTTCAMEVSSHALDQQRTRAIRFDVGVFTNLTQDHLDYHPTFDAYRDAKKKLFDGLPTDATALLNHDDLHSTQVAADTAAQVVRYGLGTGADLRGEILANELAGLHLRIEGQARRFRLVGRFNAYNLLAAYGAGRALGYPGDRVLDALAQAPPVPGRFEQIAFEDGPTVVVDYAHTPDALDNVLQTIRATIGKGHTLWCVFGCGGDRDRTKRPQMGHIAEGSADRVIVTSDNPRTEPPQAIMDDIRAGFRHPEAARWIVDRQAAIEAAAEAAAPGDVVLIAGKGHETYQIVGTEKHDFDDRAMARAAFGRRFMPSPAPTTRD